MSDSIKNTQAANSVSKISSDQICNSGGRLQPNTNTTGKSFEPTGSRQAKQKEGANSTPSVTAPVRTIAPFGQAEPTAEETTDELNKRAATFSNYRPEMLHGRARVEAGAYNFEPRIRAECVDGSRIPEHLFKKNFFINKDAQLLKDLTSWPSVLLHSVGTAQKQQGAHIAGGYWWVCNIDPCTGEPKLLITQVKPSGGAYDKDGRPIKYLSSRESSGKVFTLAVTEEEIRQVEARFSESFPYWAEVGADPDTVDRWYWTWVIESPTIPVVITEGIKKALSLLGIGFPTVALPGVNNIWEKINGGAIKKLAGELARMRQGGKPVYLCFDADIMSNANVKKALLVLGKELSKVPYGETSPCDLSVMLWPDTGAKDEKGIDDQHAKFGKERVEQIYGDAIKFTDWIAASNDRSWNSEILEDLIEGQLQKHFSVINGRFYLYDLEKGHYAPCSEPNRIIGDALERTNNPDADMEKGQFASASTPQHIRQMAQYISQKREVGEERINPAGAWCTPNGVLTAEPKLVDGVWGVKPELTPHYPGAANLDAPIFTIGTEWNYDANADRSHLKSFLGFCPEQYQETLLDFLSCSLDGNLARNTVRDRGVKGLFLVGDGLNGKDTLGKLLELLYPMRTSNIRLADIKNHDHDAQKFGLSGMDARTAVNFSSENASQDISTNETLKALVTSDKVLMAKKGCDQDAVRVYALQIHCTNKEMFISNPQLSIRSRYAFMPLPYSFRGQKDIDKLPPSARANARLADIRFSHSAWTTQHILPAMFNELCDRLAAVLNRGAIDWDCCDDSFDAIVGESDHVQQFIKSEDYIQLTDSDEDICPTGLLYLRYVAFCVDIERGVTDGYGLEATIKDACPGSQADKYDKLCGNANALSKRVASLLGRKAVRRRWKGKIERVYTGVKIVSTT